MTAPTTENGLTKKQNRQQNKRRRPGTAVAKYIRIAPRKVRLVVDVIRGRDVKDAEDLLRFLPRGASEPVSKVLNSAKANAVNNDDMLEDRLYVAQVFVDAGPTLKRILPRARGRGDTLKKRSSHITIVLAERVGAPRGRRNGQ